MRIELSGYVDKKSSTFRTLVKPNKPFMIYPRGINIEATTEKHLTHWWASDNDCYIHIYDLTKDEAILFSQDLIRYAEFKAPPGEDWLSELCQAMAEYVKGGEGALSALAADLRQLASRIEQHLLNTKHKETEAAHNALVQLACTEAVLSTQIPLNALTEEAHSYCEGWNIWTVRDLFVHDPAASEVSDVSFGRDEDVSFERDEIVDALEDAGIPRALFSDSLRRRIQERLTEKGLDRAGALEAALAKGSVA